MLILIMNLQNFLQSLEINNKIVFDLINLHKIDKFNIA